MGGERAPSRNLLVNQLGRTLEGMGLKPEDLNTIAELLKSDPADWPEQIAASGLRVSHKAYMLSQGLAAQITSVIPIETDPKAHLGSFIDFIEQQADAQSTALLPPLAFGTMGSLIERHPTVLSRNPHLQGCRAPNPLPQPLWCGTNETRPDL